MPLIFQASYFRFPSKNEVYANLLYTRVHFSLIIVVHYEILVVY